MVRIFRIILISIILMVTCAAIVFKKASNSVLVTPIETKSQNFASDLRGKLIVGYQGWFGCPGDYAGNQSWSHWSFTRPDQENLIVDLLPATDEYDEKDLSATSMSTSNGTPVYLFSSLNQNVVNKHFEWMAKYGIDGVAAQRFIADVASHAGLDRRDRVLTNIRNAAQANGRVFYVTYDVSGANEKTVYQDIEKDWRHLVQDLKITSSPSYLKHHGKPVLQIWGFGFTDRPGDPELVQQLLAKLKSGSNEVPPVTLIGGVPTCWRMLIRDSKSDPRWAATYRSYDVISPWIVNRFHDDLTADLFANFMVLPDMAETKKLGIDYMPVIFPGFSWYNLMHCENHPEKAKLNQVPRRGGQFYWKQVRVMLGAHANMLYGAMFDEVNEGTALFKVETRPDHLPAGAHLVYPKLDGAEVAPDRFLHLTGLANQYLRTGMPPPELVQ